MRGSLLNEALQPDKVAVQGSTREDPLTAGGLDHGVKLTSQRSR